MTSDDLRSEIDRFMAHQLSGTSEAMTALQYLVNASTDAAAEIARLTAERDMLRDALDGLVKSIEAPIPVDDEPMKVRRWHALEDARQALAQSGKP